jgi:hybrid polyketide synthase/nonribosomal peptide synthetase ACE1
MGRRMCLLPQKENVANVERMTIDTACSSSLVAVHQAVQVLRDGISRIAIAAGTNLLLDSGNFITGSKMNM